MRTSRSLGQLAVVFLSLSSQASAWGSWFLPDLDALIVRRDSGTTTSTSPAKTQAPTSSGQNADTTFNLNTGAVATGSSSPSATGGSDSDGNSTKTTGSPKHTQFNPEDPAGAVVMITPAATAQSQLYKIGDFVTLGWNYTNLQAPPSAVDVLASCSVASRTYTLTQNMTFQTQAAFTWDTGAYQSSAVASPLLTEQYTLIIFDAESNPTATAESGYLGTFEGFQFGMYTPQPYTALAEGWTCASCSFAVSDMDRRAIGFALTMSVITVLSFTWFVTGLGLAL